MPEGRLLDVCPKCSDPLIANKLYCPNCGLAVLALPERVAVDAYVGATVDRAVSSRLVDQSSLVREIGDKAEDIVWLRLKRYTWIVGIIIAGLAAFGIYSIRDARSKIIDEARSRLEPVISDTEKRVSTAQGQLRKSEEQIASVKTKLDETSNLADSQSSRLNAQGGEIETKLQAVQSANDKAVQLSTGFEKRVTELDKQLTAMRTEAERTSQRLTDMQKSLQVQVAAATRQIDDVSIHQAFPGIGQKMYVTFNGKPWRNPSEKKPGEKWVAIFVDISVWPDNQALKGELDSLGQALRASGFTPFFGRFGVDGPFQSGFGTLGDNSMSVFYFSPDGEKAAASVAKIAEEQLHLGHFGTKYIDPKKAQPAMLKMILENSGLDSQIFIWAPSQ